MSSIDKAIQTFPFEGSKAKKFTISDRFMIWAVCFILTCCVFHYLSEGAFLTPRNLSNLSRQICVNLTLATGMTLVILTGGIDLSVGSILALSGMVAAITQVHGGLGGLGFAGSLLSFLCALFVGGIFGAINGLAISWLKITPFIVTLGMMVICRGLTLVISSARAVAPVGESLASLSLGYVPLRWSFFILGSTFIFSIGYFVFRKLQENGDFLTLVVQVFSALLVFTILVAVFCGYQGIPYLLVLPVLFVFLASFALNYTRFGRFIYAVGGNHEAARLSGVPVGRTLWLVYLIMGVLAASGGVMDVARVDGAVPSSGELSELDAIAAVVIGGTSLMGGLGSLKGTVFGVLIMGVLNNGMNLIGLSEHYQKIFKGIVIILAVYLDLRSKKLK